MHQLPVAKMFMSSLHFDVFFYPKILGSKASMHQHFWESFAEPNINQGIFLCYG